MNDQQHENIFRAVAIGMTVIISGLCWTGLWLSLWLTVVPLCVILDMRGNCRAQSREVAALLTRDERMVTVGLKPVDMRVTVAANGTGGD